MRIKTVSDEVQLLHPTERRKEEIKREAENVFKWKREQFVTHFSAAWFEHKFLCFHLVWYNNLYVPSNIQLYIKYEGVIYSSMTPHNTLVNERSKQCSVWLSRQNRPQPSLHYQLADADCRDGAQSDCISGWQCRYLIVRGFERMI